ncbi:hypothetical protein CLV37_1247 [Kineococcus rhizosphaerae]|uniref:Uncharacterized protein n=1 Tax=Kineococcus rhizosphaerae TaxID=559628 RepID=A0A2T0QTK3_9ACTN|nr:hypothetical protein CLV37_1247 [Kineococcus rhizosphaerae]
MTEYGDQRTLCIATVKATGMPCMKKPQEGQPLCGDHVRTSSDTLCAAKKKDGHRCLSYAEWGSSVCRWHDPMWARCGAPVADGQRPCRSAAERKTGRCEKHTTRPQWTPEYAQQAAERTTQGLGGTAADAVAEARRRG